MDFLRRSIHTKDAHGPHISTPIPSVSKPSSSFHQPPKKVIRALEDHRSQAPHQLSFSKGDFFHVINEIDQGPNSGWYEANNPVTGARGLVPKVKFEEFNKSNAAVRVTQAARQPKSPSIRSIPTSPRQPVFYAIVQHDFIAERADELDAKAGDHISVVAQSNLEWFVAKPISRLGRPGLIPVSFVAIHDPSTGRAFTEDEVRDLMQRGEIPGVEEWKKSILEYKAASISLGVLDDEAFKGPVPNSPYMRYQEGPSQSTPMPNGRTSESSSRRSEQPPILPPGLLVSASVVSWHFEMDEYWFRIDALFQPDDPTGADTLPPAKELILYRAYNDFYDFQVSLLDTFPVEAGRDAKPGEKPLRILPYMPGPAPQVDDNITKMRRGELNVYLEQLCKLWELDAEHILRHKLIRSFFTAKAGDVERDVQAAYGIFAQRYAKKYGSSIHEDDEQIREPLARMDINGKGDNRFSAGSHYEEENGLSQRRPSDPTIKGRRPSEGVNGVRGSSPAKRDYDRRDPGYPRSDSPFTSTSRAQSPLPQRTGSATSGRNYSAEAAVLRTAPGHSQSYSQSRMDNGQTITYVSQRRPDDDSPRSYTSSSQPSSAVGRNRSASNANSPPISASNPNTAFVKIKIFDRLTQDLIAIRVNPRVTHAQLMDKVRSRLGDDVQHLAYRNSITNTFSALDDDSSLKQWLEGADKHVLYAD